MNYNEEIAKLFSEMISAIQNKEGYSKEEAENLAFCIFKDIIEEVKAGNVTEETMDEKVQEIATKEGLTWT